MTHNPLGVHWPEMVRYDASPKNILHQDAVIWTEKVKVKVNATDGGGDPGQYCFYFNIDVINNQVAL